MEALGIEQGLADRVLPNASPEQLELLSALVSKAASATTEVNDPSDSMSSDEYRALLERLGDEYIGTLTRRGLSESADVKPDQLQDGVEVLAETARMLRAVPPSRRSAMWPSMTGELQTALSHYQVVARALIETGVAGALDAERHVVLNHLRREVIPDLDLALLRLIGEADPELALAHMLREARTAPRSLLRTMTVAQMVEEGGRLLQPQPGVPAPVPPKAKRWTGWGKLFTGMAVAGANIAGGIALGIGGGPLAAGATVGGVIASCGAGVGSICEGVGALRGE